MKKLLSFCLILFSSHAQAQELYPNTEPASTIGKNVFGLRGIWETYDEKSSAGSTNAGIWRNDFALRLMYGVTKNLTVYAQPSFSNHHGQYLPSDFVAHSPLGNQTVYYSSNKIFGRKYPYLFGGVYAYAKYRFLSVDGLHKHFRMAAYGSYSTAKVAHDLAEPNPEGDTGGWSGGLIATKLLNHFAATLSSGFMLPNKYHETKTVDDTVFTTNLTYGNAITYTLSLGYLIYPKEFTDYSQPNYNLYLELMGKNYGSAEVFQNGSAVQVQNFALYSGNYLDADLGFQAIINSNTRMDLSVEVQLINRSWDHFYPLYHIGVQHYFYLGRKAVSNSQ